MANRYRDPRDPRQQGYDEDYSRSRQYEQFQPEGDYQYGDNSESYADYGNRSRNWRGDNRGQPRGRVRESWNERGAGRESQYDPLAEYDRDAYVADQRATDRRYANHSTFRGDDIGAGQVPGPRAPHSGGYAGDAAAPNFFFPGGSDYGRSAASREHERGFFERAGDEIASWFGDDDAERRRERDHRGRGPANYTRSNERLLEDACERLTHDRGVDARNISVTAQDNEITLDGTVNTRWEKRRAEDCVHDISGVKHVQNNLRIQETEMRAGKSPSGKDLS